MGRQPVLDPVHQQIDGNLHEHRSRASRERRPDRGREHLRNLARLGHGPGPLGDGPQQRDLLHLLERAQPAQTQWRGAADQQQRAPRGKALATPVTASVTPGPAVTRSAQTPPQAGIGVGGMGRGLLVTQVDDADALGQAAIVDRQDMTAAEREDVIGGGLLEDLRGQLTARQLSHGDPRRGLLAARSGLEHPFRRAGILRELVLRPDRPPDQLATAQLGHRPRRAGLGTRPAVGAFERANHGVGGAGRKVLAATL